MPALPTIPNVLRVDWLWDDGTDTSVSTREFYRYSGGPPTSADCLTMAADIYSAQSGCKGAWDASTLLAGTRVTDLSSDTGGTAEHIQSTAGIRDGSGLPAGTCVLVNYLISRRYRGGKPRSYFPWGVDSDVVSRQAWASGLVTEVSSVLATYFAVVIGETAGSTTITGHVNVSYYNGFTVITSPTTHRARNVPTLRTTPVVDNITSFGMSSRIASQRRRNRA